MKFNNKQLLVLSNEIPDYEGRLHFKKISINWPNENKVFKERWFKLKYNMLFYFRMNDNHLYPNEPAGVFVLEDSKIYYEENCEVPFSFSIAFKNEPETKYLFSARSDDVVHSWISKLKDATCGYLKIKLNALTIVLKGRKEKLQLDRKVSNQAVTYPSDINNFADFTSQLALLEFNSMGSKSDLLISNKNNTDCSKQQFEQNLIQF